LAGREGVDRWCSCGASGRRVDGRPQNISPSRSGSAAAEILNSMKAPMTDAELYCGALPPPENGPDPVRED
jgi:hypothetical protein